MSSVQTRLYSLSQVGGQCVMVLEEVNGPRLLPIWIGLYEGGAIGMALSGQQFPRPHTHDLFMIVLQQLSTKVKSVTITELKDSTFYAEVMIQNGTKEMAIDARPSDSVALAACMALLAAGWWAVKLAHPGERKGTTSQASFCADSHGGSCSPG